jgi:hypothetical protein
MKKINIVFIAIIALFITSCDENDANLVPRNYFVGTWEASQIGSLNAIGKVIYTDYENAGDCTIDNIIFNDNFTYTANDYEFEDGACTTSSINGTYTLNGNNLVLKHIDEFEEVEVIETRRITNFTFNELELNYTDSETNQIVFLKLIKK